jgi:DNA mismatch repair endonuclease MutH
MFKYHFADGFDPKTATEDAILERAKRLVGKPIGDFVTSNESFSEGLGRNKGRYGLLVERYFNIEPNSAPEPDFRGAGIELKSVPLIRRPGRGGLRAKERTSVTMIDYHELAKERWATASVRPKIAHILFIFFEHIPDRRLKEFPVRAVKLWKPDEVLSQDLQGDWHAVHQKVINGLAHEISEGDGRVLGAATKGANASKTVTQPYSSIRAKSRAWALKPSLTSAIYDRMAGGGLLHGSISLQNQLGLSVGDDFEAAVIRRLHVLAGLRFAEVAERLGARITASKGAAHTIVRRALGIVDDKARLKEFEDRGIVIKTVPLSPEGKTYEAMSFPYFKYAEYADEEWEDSEFLSYIQRLLVVPVMRAERKTALADRVLGRAFFWSPARADLQTIEAEWTCIRNLIRVGKADRLPSYSETEFIHARPHGRDSDDTDEDPLLGPLPKYSLWLNPTYTTRIVSENGGLSGIGNLENARRHPKR